MKLKPGFTCDCYVGLVPPFDQNVDGLLKRHGTIGAILFPIKIDGQSHDVRILTREVEVRL